MKRFISVLIALYLILCFTASAEQATDPSRGLEWGMSITEAAAVLGITDVDAAIQEADERTTFLLFDSDMLGHSISVAACTFLDSELVMFGYEDIDGNFKDVYMELYEIYGASPSYDTADFLLMAEYIMGTDADMFDIVNYNCWYYDDGTCMALITMGDSLNLYYFDMNAVAAEAGAEAAAEALFPWGATMEEVFTVYNFTEDDVDTYELSSVISICILPISEHEEETYVFANGGLVALFYDYFGDDSQTNFAAHRERIYNEFCPIEDGGAARTYAAMGLIAPTAFSSPDDIISCASGEMADGTYVSLFFYSENSYMFMVVDEDALIAAYD